MRRSLRLSSIAAAVAVPLVAVPLVSQSGAQAVRFTGGNLVVYRVGTGAPALSNAAAPVFLDEYAPGGAKVQSVALPTVAADGNKPLTATGLSRSEGLIARSADGRYVTLTGYAAAPGTTGPAGASLTASDPASVNRVVGIVDANGGVDTSTALPAASAPGVVRSAVSTDGNRLYATGGNGGIVTTTLGASGGTPVAGSADSNLNSLTVQDGQLFASGIVEHRLSAVGTGTPAGSATLTDLAGLPANLLTYGYAFLDLRTGGFAGTTLDTLYLANASSRGGTVDKYVFGSGAWTLAGSKDVEGALGIVADEEGDAVSLAITTPTKLVTLSEPDGSADGFTTGALTTLATAAAGTEFRGVALAPEADAGPSVFVRQPVTATQVSQGGSVSVSALVTGTSLSSVTAALQDGAAVALTKGAGNVWTGTVPVGSTPAGAATLTVKATNPDGTTTVTRSVQVSELAVPPGTAGPGTYPWTTDTVTAKGKWKKFSTSASPSGKGLKASKKKASLSTPVYGRGVVLTFVTGKNAGKVKVIVDGKTTTVDLYKATKGKLLKSFSFGAGDISTHTVTVKVAGKKNPKSTGKTVYAAALEVTP